MILAGGYDEGPPSIEVELPAEIQRSAHIRQKARARLVAAGIPL